jgi:hypothetical protein
MTRLNCQNFDPDPAIINWSIYWVDDCYDLNQAELLVGTQINANPCQKGCCWIFYQSSPEEQGCYEFVSSANDRCGCHISKYQSDPSVADMLFIPTTDTGLLQCSGLFSQNIGNGNLCT